MKDDLGAPHRRPTHRLGIAPALMANRHAKLHAIDLEKSPGISGHIEPIFARVELVFGLVSLNLALGIKNNGDNLPTRVRDPFHAEDRGDLICSRPLCYGLEHPFLLRLVKGAYFKILSPQTGEISFRETHDLRALGGSIAQKALDLVQAVIDG